MGHKKMKHKLVQQRRFITFTVVLIAMIFVVQGASPVIISNEGINHSLAIQLINSIPEEYYSGIFSIEFQPYHSRYDGYATTFWNRNHDCYYAKIDMYTIDRDILVHELGHIHQWCVLKQTPTKEEAEEYAKSYRIKRDKIIVS